MRPEEVEDLLRDAEAVLSKDPEGVPVLEVGNTIADDYVRLQYYSEMLTTLAEVASLRGKYRQPLVDPLTFFEHPDYMGGAMSLWPELKKAVVECLSGQYTESVWTGSLGTGKTTGAIAVTSYLLYEVLNLRDPHGELEMDRGSEISFAFQSLQGKAAYTTGYLRFRAAIESSPWFQQYAPFDKEAKSIIRFSDRRIIVEPLSGESTSAIGENIYSFVLDECNHQKVTGQSSKSADGGVYDQAMENYRALARRRESRFTRGGRVRGMICMCGSANYPGQFTDRKKDQVREQLARTGKTDIYVYDKRPWDVQPPGRFSEERFRVYYGDGLSRPRIMSPHEPTIDNVVDVPVEYYSSFASDLEGSLRDIAGIAVGAQNRFIGDAQAVAAAFGTRKNLFDPDWCDFENFPANLSKRPIQNPKEPRYIHGDLSLSMDFAGLAMGHLDGFQAVDRGDGIIETLPRIVLDFVLSIRPPGNGKQIHFQKIKNLLQAIIKLGYPVEWFSLDGFQSADMLQTAKAWGLRTGVVSMDRTPRPHVIARQAILDGRVEGPDCELLRTEATTLMWIPAKGKVDHPPGGSKDLMDCATGVIYGLTRNRKNWIRHGVPLTQIPASLKQDLSSQKSKGNV